MAHEKRPRMLNRLSRPVKPPAMAAIWSFWCVSSASNAAVMPSSVPAKTSCSIGLAIAMTPMPAVTLKNSTNQISQNCGVRNERLSATWFTLISAERRSGGGAVQPAGA